MVKLNVAPYVNGHLFSISLKLQKRLVSRVLKALFPLSGWKGFRFPEQWCPDRCYFKFTHLLNEFRDQLCCSQKHS